MMSISSIFKHMAMMAPFMGLPMAANAVESGQGTIGDIGLQSVYSLVSMGIGIVTGLPVIFDAAANMLGGDFAASTYNLGMMHDMGTQSAGEMPHTGHDRGHIKM